MKPFFRSSSSCLSFSSRPSILSLHISGYFLEVTKCKVDLYFLELPLLFNVRITKKQIFVLIMGNIDNTYIEQLKNELSDLEKKFNLQAKLHATFSELNEILPNHKTNQGGY